MKIPAKSEYRYFIFAIADEVAWCKANPDKTLSKEYQAGFVNGLERAIYLIQKTKKNITKISEPDYSTEPTKTAPKRTKAGV